MFKIFSSLYDILSTLFFIIFYPLVFVSRLHTGKDSNTRLKKFGFFNSNISKDNKVIMYHAVSVGEVLSLEKLLKKTKEVFSDYKLVLTTSTKTGQEIAHKKYTQIADLITYFPFDIPFAISKFLDKVHPNIVLIAETELWPEFAIQCKKRNIPLNIINGRISDSSYKSYKWLKIFFKPILRLYSNIFTQSETDNNRFIELGAIPENTKIMKNLKFDIDFLESDINIDKESNRILIAGSTHSGENEIIIDSYSKLKKQHSDLKLIIAPRHLERIPDIEQILKKYKLTTGFRSKNDNFISNDVIILDTLGELKKTYAICDIAFIGGSFNNTGGHNPLEATIYNIPTISGPSIKNFRDIYAILTRANASKIAHNQNEFENIINELLSDKLKYKSMTEACKNIFDNQKGALDFVIEQIKIILNI